MIDFYILRNVKNVMFHYMSVVILNNIRNEIIRWKPDCAEFWDWWNSFSEHLFKILLRFLLMICRTFHYVAISDSSFKWSNVASATKTTWQVPRLMSLVHFHTWHVNQLMKVNMNKFTIINGSSVLTVHVWWISRRVFINETTFPSLSPQRTFWCYVKLKIILISHSGFAGTSRILMQFPPVLHSSGFLWPMFFT